VQIPDQILLLFQVHVDIFKTCTGLDRNAAMVYMLSTTFLIGVLVSVVCTGACAGSGVSSVQVNVVTKAVIVAHDPSATTPATLVATLNAARLEAMLGSKGLAAGGEL
jgi:hypothetical protein